MSSTDRLPPPEPTAARVDAPTVAAPAAEPIAPVMPVARSNRMPQLAGAEAQVYVPPRVARARMSRSKVYGIGAVLFLVISVAGYIGFRSYIYGDDAPPLPVVDDLGG